MVFGLPLAGWVFAFLVLLLRLDVWDPDPGIRNAKQGGNVTVPRDREFESNADRQRAYRERKRGEARFARLPDTVVWEGREFPRVHDCTWDEEQYVAHELAVTREQIASGQIRTRDAGGHDLEPLRRSETYLRWRFNGFLAGQVASL